MSSAPRIDRLEKNLIINGNFDIWQRSTSEITTGSIALRTADRWINFLSGAGSPVESQSTDVPTNGLSKYSLKITGDTGVTSFRTLQRIEGVNALFIKDKEISLSFWLKNDTGADLTVDIAIKTPSIEDDWSSGIATHVIEGVSQVAPDGVWTKITYTKDLTGYPVERGVEFWIQVPTGASLDSNTKSINISQVMLNEGNLAGTFNRAGRNIGDELAMCQRYYEKSYNIEVNPGTSTPIGMQRYTDISSITGTRTTTVTFQTHKRSIPTVSIWDSLGNSEKVSSLVNALNNLTFGGTVPGTRSFSLDSNSVTAKAGLDYHWVVNAELL